jgi:hypothetical protein
VPFIESWRQREDGRLLPSSRLRGAAGQVFAAIGIGEKEHAL